MLEGYYHSYFVIPWVGRVFVLDKQPTSSVKMAQYAVIPNILYSFYTLHFFLLLTV